MQLNDECQAWIEYKVMESAIGCCCEISNAIAVKKDFKTKESKPFLKIKFLITNFSSIVKFDTLVDDFYSMKRNKESHWNTKKQNNSFKSFLKMAIEDIRDSKISEILK